MQNIVKIETEKEYREALTRFMEICQTQKSDEDLRELLLLSDLMEKYERAQCSNN